MQTKNRRLLVALARRQVFFLAFIATAAGVYFAMTGTWLGWPVIIFSSVIINIAWWFVA